MNAVMTFEQNTGAYFAGLMVRAVARAVVLAAWAGLRGAVALCGLWRPVGLFVALTGIVAICAAYPLLPVACGLVALFGWVTYPRPATRANVSWNSDREVSA